MMKLCKGCNTEQPIANYAKSKHSKDGHQARCKTCFKQYKTKPRLKQSREFEGEYKKPTFKREQLLKQIALIRDRESNPQTASRANYSFLFTNPKYYK
jgi:hypothetical protein